jgi:hypothetical protein
MFFALFMATKIVVMLKVLEQGGNWQEGVTLMFDQETQGLFAAVVSFWFGQRSVSKFMGKK